MLSILITLILLYLLCTRCRGSHPGWPELQDWSYAHRGLHDSRLPENSLAAFRAAMENGYGISFDRGADFVICIDGPYNSRVVVQERYEALKSTYWESY